MQASSHELAASGLDTAAEGDQHLALALELADIGLWDWDLRTGEMRWSDEHFRLEGYEPGEVTPSFEAWLDRVHPEDREAAIAAVERARAEKSPFHHEFRSLHPGGAIRWLLGRGRFFYGPGGEAQRMVGVLIDVTERNVAMARQRRLVAKLQHRVRNMLSVIRYVFIRTVESSPNLRDATQHFRGRLDALARTQVAATQSEPGLVDLETLIRDELLMVGAEEGDGVTLSGPQVLLEHRVAEPLGLAFHELATNSLKFGALKRKGKIRIIWDINMDKVLGPLLTLVWQEQDVPVVPVIGQGNGFGTELIEDALPYRLGARTSFEVRPGGVICEIAIPLHDENCGGESHGGRNQ